MTSSAYRPDRREFIQLVTPGIAGLSWLARGVVAERRWTAIRKLIDGYVTDKQMAGVGVAIAYDGAPVT